MPTPVSPAATRPPAAATLFELLASVRLELLLLLLCIGQATRVFLVFPIRAQTTKEIFMGMKVELERNTQLVMMYSDLISHHILVTLGIVVLLLVGLVGGIRLLVESAHSAQRRGGDALARTQVVSTTLLTLLLIGLFFLASFMDQALTSPMLRLISAVD